MEKRKRNKKTKDKKRLNLTKPFLIREYTDNKKSIPTIAKEINCGQMTIWRYLKRFGIKRRTLSEVKKGEKNPNFGGKFNGVRGDTRGENNPGYIDGRTKKKYYCIDCLKRGIKIEITYHGWKYGHKLCRSCVNKGKNNPNFGKILSSETIAKILKGRVCKKPNKPEKLLDGLLNQILPKEYRFVGDGKIIIDRFNPDFINCNGQKKIIEFYGNYWHNKSDYKKRDKRRIIAYKKYGYKTLIIWEHELDNLEKVKEKIMEFNKED